MATEPVLNRRRGRRVRSGGGRRGWWSSLCWERRKAGLCGPEAGVHIAEPDFTGLPSSVGSVPGFHRADGGRETEKLEI
jgi:hypothetical protein